MHVTRQCQLVFIGCLLMTLLFIAQKASLNNQLKYINVNLSSTTDTKNITYEQLITLPPVIKYPLDLVYPYNYSFILNEPNKCNPKAPFLVLLILSQANELASRKAIREMWGNESLVPGVSIMRLFLLGMPKGFTVEIQRLLVEESMLFHDIIQQDFMDSYVNLTIKTMMGLQWVSMFCPSASYAMKIDSDMFLNTEYLVKFLNPEIPRRTNYFTGYMVRNAVPFRDPKSKFYVPFELYPAGFFPPYCGGPGYVFSAEMAKKIYDAAQVIKAINMEDVFVGLCLQKLGISITESPASLFNWEKIEYEVCRYAGLITVHHIALDELKQIWTHFMLSRHTCSATKVI
ncbi:beta-1,3-galactosyltransferase 2-like [Protopterus annectens]|uniref:beta-1,3-galactosyltransferase 2-like n=1 Tax=Protopterus annectens TaxID=7888 RepID=UPI001CF96017|nr:beta-1,3-galactosyltransferase 2-like [Protopterus annectens]XP_043940706.1 beta-1,3-galactosyltransferase 2-like [Protopterus annectens]XP_043940708.1 beta-1,3-galactosyltransferase 2-like [Protopterus annectens]XP_043940709.1 beta-1,3-galactosyltransferase 2-like [Protopterus annectens]